VKRVLNSGTIKLPYVKGTEKDEITFTFEIKAPLLTFLAFRDSNLGTLNHLAELDHPLAYVPAEFYKKDDSGYTAIDSKQCNIYSTKLFNFYNAALNFHNNLLKEGLCLEQAALVLPQGLFLNFLWEITLTDLVAYIEQHYSDSPEIYGYCSTFVLYLEEHAPEMIKSLKATRWQNFSL
jgi:hypothetical protein